RQLDAALLRLFYRPREPLFEVTDLITGADHIVTHLTAAVSTHDDLEGVVVHEVGDAFVLVRHCTALGSQNSRRVEPDRRHTLYDFPAYASRPQRSVPPCWRNTKLTTMSL